jgi:hypothetical protein
MPQLTLLFLELLLLAATLTVFWKTRQLLTAARTQVQPAGASPEVAGDIAGLLAEWQSAANAARTDWVRQNALLQEGLHQAEQAAVELRALLARADAFAPGAVSAPQPFDAPGTASLTLAEAIAAYDDHLKVQGRSRSAADRTLHCVREFAVWWGGQRWERLPLGRIEPADLEAYGDHLQSVNNQPPTVKRKQVTLRAFADWANALAGSCLAAPRGSPPADGAGVPNGLPPTPADRYRTALALHEQGLDQESIAARAGLEQEVVRMLLTLGPPAQTRH